jgi:hypothetical protein
MKDDEDYFLVEGRPMDGSEISNDIGAEPVLYWANHRYELNLVTRRYVYAGQIWMTGPVAQTLDSQSLTKAPTVAPFEQRIRQLLEYCAANNKTQEELCTLAAESFKLNLEAEPAERELFFKNLAIDYTNWLAISADSRAQITMKKLRDLRSCNLKLYQQMVQRPRTAPRPIGDVLTPEQIRENTRIAKAVNARQRLEKQRQPEQWKAEQMSGAPQRQNDLALLFIIVVVLLILLAASRLAY